MRFVLALLYFILCISNLIYNMFVEKYAIGIYLSWTVIKLSVVNK